MLQIYEVLYETGREESACCFGARLGAAFCVEVAPCFGIDLFAQFQQTEHSGKRHKGIEEVAESDRYPQWHHGKHYKAEYVGVCVQAGFFLPKRYTAQLVP